MKVYIHTLGVRLYMKKHSIAEMIIVIITLFLILSMFLSVIGVYDMSLTVLNIITGLMFMLIGVLNLLKENKLLSINFFICSLLFFYFRNFPKLIYK